MKKVPKILIAVILYNEKGKTDQLLLNLKKLKLSWPHEIIFVNDGSTDGTPEIIADFLKQKKLKAKILSNQRNEGVGYSIRKAIFYGIKNGFDICTIMAGNGKDNPLEIPELIQPIIESDYDYIQGSRFLQGGSYNNLPFLRKSLIKAFTFTFFLFTKFKQTDSTNGFRAYKLSIFKNKQINLNQSWLNRYELETYLHYKVISLGFKIKEVSVSKNYLEKVKNYSKIRPVVDWWKMFRPLILLKFKLKN
jgi:dolichol-phosphate mannosyltransferase